MSIDQAPGGARDDVSVVDPVSKGVNTVGNLLFRNSASGRWLSLGFCAFLIALGIDGAGIYGQLTNLTVNLAMGAAPAEPAANGQDAPRELPAMLQQQAEARLRGLQDNWQWWAAIGGAAATAFLLTWLLFQWLAARGRFMFIDNLANDRALVTLPWREYRREANSLFALNVTLAVGVQLGTLAILAGMLRTAWPDVEAKHFGDAAERSLWVGGPLMLLWTLVARLLQFTAQQLLPPIMSLRRVGWMSAAGTFRREILADRPGRFLLLFLFHEVLQIGAGSVAMTLNCATCCAGTLPFAQQVLLLPVTAFLQAYFMHYLEQFGPTWKFFVAPAPPPTG